ncbi:MAG: hypothetical protein CMI88_03285 [Pelagibacteraceae bacterium]|nr:hypothetical protein [Pelagibacteraceae bacterium]MAN18151.1 hypothetical protein [Pelagibacteraceae bacterium]|tara:strand:- start:1596 stop:2003 length:408 start_codon:yes stop_codon:yes gene_type:complete
MNLNAIDTDELKIIATILQDGLVEVSEVKYLPSIRSFIIMITRFMWEEKIINKENKRVKAVLVFEDVLSVFSKNIDQMNKSNTLELMTFNYFPTKTKNIEIQLLFKNDAIIKLETEIIKCKLQDQGKPWSVKIVE